MSINIADTFIKIWDYSINGNLEKYKKLGLILPYELQVLMTSDGSLTRNNAIISNDQVTVDIIDEICYIKTDTNQSIRHTNKKRFIWLVRNHHKNVFAQSHWQLIQGIEPFIDFNQPIGKELILSEVNIHRDLLNIYFGYCNLIEEKFNHTGPLWGRSYKINASSLSPIFIHEVFSPSLIKTIQ